jgi:hypothetical protein
MFVVPTTPETAACERAQRSGADVPLLCPTRHGAGLGFTAPPPGWPRLKLIYAKSLVERKAPDWVCPTGGQARRRDRVTGVAGVAR